MKRMNKETLKKVGVVAGVIAGVVAVVKVFKYLKPVSEEDKWDEDEEEFIDEDYRDGYFDSVLKDADID